MAPTRGRPKEYDPATALQAAGQVFWSKGFSATSLDELADAMARIDPAFTEPLAAKRPCIDKPLGSIVRV